MNELSNKMASKKKHYFSMNFSKPNFSITFISLLHAINLNVYHFYMCTIILLRIINI